MLDHVPFRASEFLAICCRSFSTSVAPALVTGWAWKSPHCFAGTTRGRSWRGLTGFMMDVYWVWGCFSKGWSTSNGFHEWFRIFLSWTLIRVQLLETSALMIDLTQTLLRTQWRMFDLIVDLSRYSTFLDRRSYYAWLWRFRVAKSEVAETPP